MKITIKTRNNTFNAEVDNIFGDPNLTDMAQMLKGLLVSAGFHPNNVDDLFNTEDQWFTDKEQEENLQGHLKDDRYNEGYAKGRDEALYSRKVQEFQENLYRPERTHYEHDDYDIFT